MKTLLDIFQNDAGHWVGDGFPVRSLFTYHGDAQAISPFLLFDYAGPHDFDPPKGRRAASVSTRIAASKRSPSSMTARSAHRDSTGGGGTISPGDVQWMTAGGGIIHEEFHSRGLPKTGGPFRMVQLWVNLPAKDKHGAGWLSGDHS